MKIMTKLLYLIAALLMLFCGLVVVCAFRPDVTTAIAGFLYPEQKQNIVVEIKDVPEPDKTFDISDKEAVADVVQPDSEPRDFSQEGSENPEHSIETNDGSGIGGNIVSGYVPPNESEIMIPEKVSGRNGYQQIQDEQEQIDEEAVRQLQNQLDVGNTGDGLEFNAVYYPYYDMLDEKAKHMYRQIYANANALYAVFAPVEQVTAGELKSIFSAVYNDHPELFWLETAYVGKYVRSGQCVEIDLKFNRTTQDLESARAAFDTNANQILTQAQGLANNYEKEKFVHDMLVDKVSYQIGAEMSQSAYSALVNGQTVCAGYARAFQYLLQQMGIPCYYCIGYAGESHAWNIVALDDGYYNVDTTWDDTGSGNYDYFNKTDADYASSHIRQELSVYLPPCNGQAYRNLEQSGEGNNLRSLANVGVTEEQVLTDMQQYYEDCYNRIVHNGIGNYTFYNVIEGEEMVNEWHRIYDYGNYQQAYMDDAMMAVGASFCNMELEMEELQGGRYLVSHYTSLW